jgi:hypothetical protein
MELGERHATTTDHAHAEREMSLGGEQRGEEGADLPRGGMDPVRISMATEGTHMPEWQTARDDAPCGHDADPGCGAGDAPCGGWTGGDHPSDEGLTRQLVDPFAVPQALQLADLLGATTTPLKRKALHSPQSGESVQPEHHISRTMQQKKSKHNDTLLNESCIIEMEHLNSTFNDSFERQTNNSNSLTQGLNSQGSPGEQSQSHTGRTIHRHGLGEKKEWQITTKPNTKTLILADSNFKLVEDIPDDWEVHVYPGINLSYVRKILNNPRSSITPMNSIVIAIGLNDRTGPSMVNTTQELVKAKNAAEKCAEKVHFLGISIPDPTCPGRKKLTQDERVKIGSINEEAKKRFGRNHYIAPIPAREVAVIAGDTTGIHHTPATVQAIFNSIKVHLNY